jgi:hypothetical protein
VNGETVTLLTSYLDSLAAGGYTLTVYYNPLGEPYAGGDEPETTVIALTVEKATPGVALTATAPTAYGDDVVLTATVSKVGTGGIPTGTVTFLIDGAAVTNSSNIGLNAAGVATFTVTGLNAGDHEFKVVYSGGADYKTNDNEIDDYNMEIKSPSDQTIISTPKTGDNSNMTFWVCLCCASMISLFLIIILWRRKEEEEERELVKK